MKTSTNHQASGAVISNTTAVCGKNNNTFARTKLPRLIHQLSRGFALSIGLSLLAITQALADSFSLTKIADTRNDFTNIDHSVAINDNGTVAFTASSPTKRGLFTSNGDQITQIADSEQFDGYFIGFVGAINNKDSVALTVGVKPAPGSGFPTTAIATIIDGTFKSRVNVSGRPGQSLNYAYALNNQDQLVCLYGLIKELILFSQNKSTTIARVPSANSNSPEQLFIGFNDAAITNSGEVIFGARKYIPATSYENLTPAIFASNGNTITNIVDIEATKLNVNDNGLVIFLSKDAIQLLNRASGNLDTIADITSSQYKTFSTPTINNNGNIAFTATLKQGEKGIFTGSNPTTDKVIATGDSLDGSTVINLNFLRSGLNNNGQIVFFAQLADGTKAIYRADPAVETPPPQPQPPADSFFTLTKLVDTLTPIPGGSGNFRYVDTFLTDGDNVVFRTREIFGNSGGFYKSSGGTLSTIANQNTPVSNGIGNFYSYTFNSLDQIVLLDNNKVAFNGSEGFGDNSQRGIYIQGDDGLQVVVDKNTAIPGGTGNFTGFGDLVGDQNNLAFTGGSFDGVLRQNGIFISRDGNLQLVANTNTPIPNGSGNLHNFKPLVLDGSNLAFRASDAEGKNGFYISRDSNLQLVADLNTPIPNGTGNFSNLDFLVLYKGILAFRGLGASGQDGIYIDRDGSLQLVADLNTPIPGGTGNFNSFDSFFNSRNPLVLKNNNLVFRGFGASGQQGIYTYRDGELQALVDTNTNAPGKTIKFSNIGDFAFDGNNLAFRGSFKNDLSGGLYAMINGSLLKVADVTSRIDGKRITSIDSISIKGNSLTFSAIFADDSRAIVRANLITDQSLKSTP